MRIGFRIPSLAKRIAARTSIKRFVRHSLRVKAPRGLGWITNPKRALYNRIYSRTTRGCMLYLVILLTGLVWFLVGCDFQPATKRGGKPTYVSPSVDSRGRVRKGYVRMPVSTNNNAVRNQGKSRYYYETRGKYRRK
jgi:hypothetical protein